MDVEQIARAAERLADYEPGKVIRFSECVVGNCRSGHVIKGYQWASVRTGSTEVMQYLRLCWNHRATIAKAVRQYLETHNNA